MKAFFYILFLSLFVFFISSCSQPSMEDDAQRAAELSMMSNQYSLDNDMSKAAKAFEECQEIMDKYKKNDKFEEFYQLYALYLEESAYKFEEESAAKPANDNYDK